MLTVKSSLYITTRRILKLVRFGGALTATAFSVACVKLDQNRNVLLAETQEKNRIPTALVKQWEINEQGISAPESVIHDSSLGVIYVANMNTPSEGGYWEDTNGYISKLSETGEVLNAHWVQGLQSPKGMVIIHDQLWVTDNNRVVSINTQSGQIDTVFIAPPNISRLNDIAYHQETQRLFVSEFNSNNFEIYQIDRHGNYSVFYQQENARHPFQNGLYVDGHELVMTGQVGQLQSIDLNTGAVRKITTDIGDMKPDGIWPYHRQGYLLSAGVDKKGLIYFVSRDGSKVINLLNSIGTVNRPNPADASYSPQLNLMLTPDFTDDNKITAYTIR